MSAHNVKKNKPIIIGLTGGIGSGKSTATSYLKQKNIHVIDSDHIVKKLYLEHTPMLEKIYQTFGIYVRSSMDKKALAQIIFNDPNKRKALNDIIHPYVFQTIEDEIKKHKEESIIVIDMPLLFEVGYQEHCDMTLLIYLPEEEQINRLMKRDGLILEEAIKRVQSQMPMSDKKELATCVIDNQGSQESLFQALDQFLEGV